MIDPNLADRAGRDRRWLDWLGEGPARAPGDLLEGLLADLPAQRHARRSLPGGGWPRTRSVVTLGAGVLLGAGLLAAATAFQPSPAPVHIDPSPQPTAPVRRIASTVLPGPLFVARADAAAVTLADGRALLVRGVDPEGSASWAEPYDPAAFRFTVPLSLEHAGADSAAVLLGDGSVFVTGGLIGVGSERVRIGTGTTFEEIGTTEHVHHEQWRTQAAVARLPDGRVLLAGGTDLGHAYETAEVWDPVTEAFAPTGDLRAPRRRASAVALADGRVLLAGGHDDGNLPVRMVETWDMGSGTWSVLGELPLDMTVTTLLALPDGDVLAIGSRTDDGLTGWDATAVRIDPDHATFHVLPGHDLVRDATHTLLPDGEVLGIGGRLMGPDGPMVAPFVLRLDPQTGAVREVAHLQVARWRHAAALLADGSVLVMGGDADPASTPGKPDASLLATAELVVRP